MGTDGSTGGAILGAQGGGGPRKSHPRRRSDSEEQGKGTPEDAPFGVVARAGREATAPSGMASNSQSIRARRVTLFITSLQTKR